MAGPIDLYLVAGQSNAEGRGSSASSPAVLGGSLMSAGGGALAPLADPVGGATTGSAWPAFANAYYQVARTPVCIAEGATGGTSLLAGLGGSGDWSTTGTLFTPAVEVALAARRSLVDAGWTPTIRGVLWHQGESDALGYVGDYHDLRDAYYTALVALQDRFEAALGRVGLGLYVFRMGRPNSGDTEPFRQVRLAQGNACAADPDIHLVYTGCVDFPGLGWMSDDLHYTQTGYNDMGTTAAPLVAAHARAGARLGDGTTKAVTYVVNADGTTLDPASVSAA